MPSPKKTAVETAVDGGTITSTGVIGKGYVPDGGTITDTGVIGKSFIGKPSSAPVAAATPATFPAAPPLRTAPAGIVTATGVTKAGYQEPPAGYTSEGGRINSTGVTGKAFGTPSSGTAVAALPLDTFSKDWRISKNADGVFSHLAPNTMLPEGHTLVPNSNSPNINRAIINFRLNNQKNAATPAVASAPTSDPTAPAAAAAAPAGNDPAAPAPAAAPAANKDKPKWWSTLRGSALDLPTRLGVRDADGQKPAPIAGNDFFWGEGYNALNRNFGDAQRSFTDIQKDAYPDLANLKEDVGNESALHRADLLRRGETESITVIGPNGVPMDKIRKRNPQFEEDQTMSTAKEKRAMARSQKWSQTESVQKSWAAKYFKGK